MALIAVDGRFLGTGTGLSNFTNLLLSEMVAEGTHDYVVLIRDGVSLDLAVRTVSTKIEHYSLGEQVALPQLFASTGAGLAFYPHFNAPLGTRMPYVVTVHDLILHRHPGDASAVKQGIYRTLLRAHLRRARRVIAVSDWTKQDLATHYGDRIASKTRVCGEGSGPAFHPRSNAEVSAATSRLGLEGDYFVYVGNAKPHKNLTTLVEAHHRSGSSADLLLVTGDPDALQFRSDQVKVASGVGDDELAAIYTGARSFVTASLDEGYCLPVAEALACGCPVIASNRGAIPETAAGHARLIEPTVDAMAEAIGSPGGDQGPVQVGSWPAAARRVIATLDEVLNETASPGSP